MEYEIISLEGCPCNFQFGYGSNSLSNKNRLFDKNIKRSFEDQKLRASPLCKRRE